MKKQYEKPEIEKISFRAEDELMFSPLEPSFGSIEKPDGIL